MQERVQLESPRGESCGGLMDHITVRDNSSRGKLCTSVQAEAGLRLAELHSETMSQFSQLALEEEEQLAHFATTEADCHQHYANYAKFVQDTCAKRMKLLSKLQQMSKDWLEL